METSSAWEGGGVPASERLDWQWVGDERLQHGLIFTLQCHCWQLCAIGPYGADRQGLPMGRITTARRLAAPTVVRPISVPVIVSEAPLRRAVRTPP